MPASTENSVSGGVSGGAGYFYQSAATLYIILDLLLTQEGVSDVYYEVKKVKKDNDAECNIDLIVFPETQNGEIRLFEIKKYVPRGREKNNIRNNLNEIRKLLQSNDKDIDINRFGEYLVMPHSNASEIDGVTYVYLGSRVNSSFSQKNISGYRTDNHLKLDLYIKINDLLKEINLFNSFAVQDCESIINSLIGYIQSKYISCGSGVKSCRDNDNCQENPFLKLKFNQDDILTQIIQRMPDNKLNAYTHVTCAELVIEMKKKITTSREGYAELMNKRKGSYYDQG